MLLWVLLGGCTSREDEMGQALSLRSRLNAAQNCRFDAGISADFGDKVYAFSMESWGTAPGT